MQYGRSRMSVLGMEPAKLVIVKYSVEEWPVKATKNLIIERADELAKELQVSSEEGILMAQDDGCATLCGVIRDCAHKLKWQAQLERVRHLQEDVLNSPTPMEG